MNYVSFVDLSDNDLVTFPNVFDVYPSVKRLQLIDNDIHYIDADMLPHSGGKALYGLIPAQAHSR